MGILINLAITLSLIFSASLAACTGSGGQETAYHYNEVIFACEREQPVLVRFYPGRDSAVLMRDGQSFNLTQEPVGSGFSYANKQVSIRGKGKEMSISIGRMTPMSCHAQ